MFPTHVGMNRLGKSMETKLTHVPHTRGDEPADRVSLTVATGCSPHTWG